MQLEVSVNDLLASLPVFVLCGWGMFILMYDLVIGPRYHAVLGWAGLMGLAAALVTVGMLWQQGVQGFGGMLVQDGFALFLSAIGIIATALTILASMDYMRLRGIERGEYYALLLFSTAGMLLMASGTDLIVIFLGLELLSIPLYVLAGFARPEVKSEEAALKYFLLGAFASGFLVYGIALVYGATGTTSLIDLAGLVNLQGLGNYLLIGAGLILVGLGFKVAAAPFHMWTPDVYEGAPTPVTGFMSVVAKAAGFAALLRVFVYALPALYADWQLVVAVMAALTMIVGNVAAVAQTSLKRMLAYSSIAHAGYLLMGVAAGNRMGVAGALFYVMAYTFTNIGAFAVLSALAESAGQPEDQSLERYAGLVRRQPFLAVAMAIFMLSLTGIPPTAGFFAKYYVFAAALGSDLLWLVLIGVVTSLVSAFYYLRVVVALTMQEPKQEWPAARPAYDWALGIAVTGTVLLGLVPAPWLAAAEAGLRLLAR
jgi:NADH-quinone oxidoreductase subunit N